MTWAKIVAAVLAGAAATLSGRAAPPAFSDYRIVLERNVFDATRVPYQKAEPTPVVVARPAPPVAKILTLAGVFLADSRALALFVAGDRECTNVAVGEALDQLTVTAVDSAGVRLRAGENEFAVTVGEQLSDGGKGEWSVVGRAAQAPSAQAVIDERTAASRADLLKQMMERRKRELEK